MTRAEMVYADTLNLLGTGDVPTDELQDAIDQEHALADPLFARELAKRWTMRRLMAN